MIRFLSHSRRADLYRRDPSFFYRCENLSNALADLGLDAGCLHRSTFGKPTRNTSLVFHRPRSFVPFGRPKPPHAALDWHAAEVDDLVFDPAQAVHSPAVRNKHLTLWQTKWMFRANGRALGRFSRISTSTAQLAKQLQASFPNADIGIFPNCVAKSWLGYPIQSLERDKRRLTYFPGTRGHDADFAMICGPVENFLLAHPDWELFVVGPLDFRLAVPGRQIVRMDRVPFEKYHEVVQTGAINLAPLESTTFNECKSALKIMEAGFFGIPTLASPIPDAQRFAGDGVEFAAASEEWAAGLIRLAGQHPWSMPRRHALRERILGAASIENEAKRWLDWSGIVER
jgi:hypothetical protein